MNLLILALVIIGAVALYKMGRKSFKKHPFLWGLGIIATIALVIIF